MATTSESELLFGQARVACQDLLGPATCCLGLENATHFFLRLLPQI